MKNKFTKKDSKHKIDLAIEYQSKYQNQIKNTSIWSKHKRYALTNHKIPGQVTYHILN